MTTALLKAAWICGMLLALGSAPLTARGQEVDKYIWETPRATNIDQAKTAPMVDALQQEVAKILPAGSLAPLRMNYADLRENGYFIYYERGRLVATLAYAYPHVSKELQEGIRKYVAEGLARESDAPWTPGIKARDEGARRELHGYPISEGQYADAKVCPTLHVLYGLWLYGDRTGDWKTIQGYWPKIRSYYTDSATTQVRLMGQMSAHVAMARLAKRFGDAETQAAAESGWKQDQQVILGLAKPYPAPPRPGGAAAGRAGRSAGSAPASRPVEMTTEMDERQKKTRYARFYDPRAAGGFQGQPWMFLDASPEILRFAKDNVKDAAIARVTPMETRYPLRWLHQAPQSPRWTGDEGQGIPADAMGMFFPVERWIKDTPPERLAQFMRSIPTGIGDSYWMESLVQTIEAFGTVRWERVP